MKKKPKRKNINKWEALLILSDCLEFITENTKCEPCCRYLGEFIYDVCHNTPTYARHLQIDEVLCSSCVIAVNEYIKVQNEPATRRFSIDEIRSITAGTAGNHN